MFGRKLLWEAKLRLNQNQIGTILVCENALHLGIILIARSHSLAST